jgi:hypothetical protein
MTTLKNMILGVSLEETGQSPELKGSAQARGA